MFSFCAKNIAAKFDIRKKIDEHSTSVHPFWKMVKRSILAHNLVKMVKNRLSLKKISTLLVFFALSLKGTVSRNCFVNFTSLQKTLLGYHNCTSV